MGPFLQILQKLNNAGVEYVVVGGVAAGLHGSALETVDLDVCCRMTPENIDRLLTAILDLNPVFRDPRRIPLPNDAARLARFNHILLMTDLGRFDVLNEIAGIGRYEQALDKSVTLPIGNLTVPVLSLDALIDAKRAAGRDKDKLGVMHLLAVKKRLKDQSELF